MRSSLTLPALLLGASASVIAAAQTTEQRTVFRTGVTTVAVHATVQDRSGRLVPDLPRDAFRVFSNGRQMDVTLFSNDPQPLTAVVLLDMSASMTGKQESVRDSAHRFIDALHQGDRIRIGTFGNEVSLSPHLTGDRSILRRIVDEELWPGGYTPLWRAISLGMDSLIAEHGRLVVLVLSDGKDTSDISNPQLPGLPGGSSALVSRFQSDSRFMLYAIGFRDARGSALERDLIRVASITGGAHFELPRDADLTSTFARIAAELRNQYLLGFEPRVLDGRQHRLEVTVNRPGLTVRARRTYLAGTGA